MRVSIGNRLDKILENFTSQHQILVIAVIDNFTLRDNDDVIASAQM